MAKGDIERETIFHIIITLLILYIGASIVLGFNPLTWTKKGQLSQTFEPGKLYISNTDAQGGIESLIKFDCSQAAYILTIAQPKFFYKGAAGKSLDFILVLDYKNLLFVGKDDDENMKTVHCTPDEKGEEYQCPESNINFKLQGVGGVTGEQVFHFTAWNAKPSVISAADDPDQTLASMLGSYPESYMTSFDAAVNVDIKCKETKCSSLSKTPCDEENADTGDCYWRSPWNIDWLSGCKPCPSDTTCSKYDRDACVKCAIPKANCQVSIIGGCEHI